MRGHAPDYSIIALLRHSPLPDMLILSLKLKRLARRDSTALRRAMIVPDDGGLQETRLLPPNMMRSTYASRHMGWAPDTKGALLAVCSSTGSLLIVVAYNYT
jgi:hypothetical protein